MAQSTGPGHAHIWGIERLAQEYLTGLPTWRFDEDRLDAMYDDFEAFLLATETQFVVTLPLNHFSAEPEKVQFSDGVMISRLSRDEL